MDYRTLVIAAACAAGLGAVAQPACAETIATDTGIAVKQADVATPTRGMTMNQVASKFGDPVNKMPPVDKPAITRWEYPGFVVYFEQDHVIHSVVKSSETSAHSAP
jgi:hypothetical protein